MKVDVRFRGLQSSDALRTYAKERIEFALGRFGGHVGSAQIRIADINGPRGGLDKRCQVIVKGRGFGSSMVEEFHTDPYAVVDLALDRVARAIGRGLDRIRHYRNRAARRLARA